MAEEDTGGAKRSLQERHNARAKPLLGDSWTAEGGMDGWRNKATATHTGIPQDGQSLQRSGRQESLKENTHGQKVCLWQSQAVKARMDRDNDFPWQSQAVKARSDQENDSP